MKILLCPSLNPDVAACVRAQRAKVARSDRVLYEPQTHSLRLRKKDSHDRDRRRPRPPDPRQPGQSDGGGRRPLEDGSLGRAAVPSGASTARTRRRTARRRQEPLGRQGRREGGARGQRRDRRAIVGARPRTRPRSTRDDRARRQREQGPARAPMRSWGSAWRRPKRPRSASGCRSTATSAGSARTCCRCR
jgi:hypothetical protein